MVDGQQQRPVSRRRLLAGAGLAGVTALAGCAGRFGGQLDESTTVSESYDAAGLAALEASTINGELTITGEDRETVALDAEKRASSREALRAVTLDVTEAGDTLSVTVDDEEAAGLTGPTPQVDLELAVPADMRVAQVESVNGVIDVSGVFGPMVVRSTNGDVSVSGINGDVDVELVNGRIEVDGVDGDVTAGATNGEITVRSVTGDVTADSANGDVSVTDVDGSVNG
jgi:DUF4097 and DUF4098 domain-containing protein YvlB